jgi:hypothetical protein
MYGLANMSLFLFLVNYIAALVAVQLLRGDFGYNTTINFGEAFNAFLAMYQVFSSENWVDVMYGAAQAEIQLRQTAIVIIFISGWMIFANCKCEAFAIIANQTNEIIVIVLQMFIAVINENFEVAEEAKKGKQATHFLNQNQAEEASAPWLRRLNPYRWVKANPVTVKVENLPSNLVLPMQKALIQDFGAQRQEPRPVVVSSYHFLTCLYLIVKLKEKQPSAKQTFQARPLLFQIPYSPPETLRRRGEIKQYYDYTTSREAGTQCRPL